MCGSVGGLLKKQFDVREPARVIGDAADPDVPFGMIEDSVGALRPPRPEFNEAEQPEPRQQAARDRQRQRTARSLGSLGEIRTTPSGLLTPAHLARTRATGVLG